MNRKNSWKSGFVWFKIRGMGYLSPGNSYLDERAVLVAGKGEVEVERAKSVVDEVEDGRVAERTRHAALAHEGILERKSARPLLLAALHDATLPDVDHRLARVELGGVEATQLQPQCAR